MVKPSVKLVEIEEKKTHNSLSNKQQTLEKERNVRKRLSVWNGKECFLPNWNDSAVL
jgi:hypothetical protein